MERDTGGTRCPQLCSWRAILKTKRRAYNTAIGKQAVIAGGPIEFTAAFA
jgi:hypothetical protein